MQHAVDEAAGQVVVDRHGVEVPGDHDPLGAAQLGAGDDRVAASYDVEVGQGRSAASTASAIARSSQADGLDVDQRGGQRDRVEAEVQDRVTGRSEVMAAVNQQPLGGTICLPQR